jgi:Holliday junction resolvase-like predicted endonuclease
VPRLDFYHNAVRRALQKDGWTITHDPFLLRWGDTTLFVDLGAELIAAEKPTQRIVVEVKNFSQGTMAELQKALGQYLMYERILARTEEEKALLSSG